MWPGAGIAFLSIFSALSPLYPRCCEAHRYHVSFAALAHSPVAWMKPWTQETVRSFSDNLLIRNVIELRHALNLLEGHDTSSNEYIEYLRHGLDLMEQELLDRGLDYPARRDLLLNTRHRKEQPEEAHDDSDSP